LKKKLGFICPPYKNPADFVLEVTGAGIGKKLTTDPAESWKASSSSQAVLTEIEKLQKDEYPVKTFASKYALPFHYQIYEGIKRYIYGFWRSPEIFMFTVIRAVILSLVFGTVYFRLGNEEKTANERVSVLFFSAVFANLTAFAYIPKQYLIRPIFYRERADGMYRVLAFGISVAITDIPAIMIGAIIFSIPYYWIIGLAPFPGRFFFFILVFLGLQFCCVSFAVFLGVWVPSSDIAGIIYGTLFGLFAMSAGFLLPKPQIPDYYIWLYHISFLRYALEPLVLNEMNPTTFYCNNKTDSVVPVNVTVGNITLGIRDACPITTGYEIIQHFGMNEYAKWIDVGVLFGYYLFFLVLSLIGLRFINHQKR